MSNKGIKCKEKEIHLGMLRIGIIRREWKGFSVVMTEIAASF